MQSANCKVKNANCPPEAPPEVDSPRAKDAPQAKDALLAEKMKSVNIKNVKCEQKTPKAERILTFAICNFSAKSAFPLRGTFCNVVFTKSPLASS